MIATIVYIHVRPDHINDFISASEQNHEQSVKEPGNLRFDFLQKTEDPCEFVFYEAYEDDKSAAAHKETAHYKTWRDSVAEMMAKPREGVKYTGLKPV